MKTENPKCNTNTDTDRWRRILSIRRGRPGSATGSVLASLTQQLLRCFGDFIPIDSPMHTLSSLPRTALRIHYLRKYSQQKGCYYGNSIIAGDNVFPPTGYLPSSTPLLLRMSLAPSCSLPPSTTHTLMPPFSAQHTTPVN